MFFGSKNFEKLLFWKILYGTKGPYNTFSIQTSFTNVQSDVGCDGSIEGKEEGGGREEGEE